MEPVIGSNPPPQKTTLENIKAWLRTIELQDHPPKSSHEGKQSKISIKDLLGMVPDFRCELRSQLLLQTHTDNVEKRLEECRCDLQDLCHNITILRQSTKISSLPLDNNAVAGCPTAVYTTKSFEKFMKQEVCLLFERQPAVYVFYNKLHNLCWRYNIMLKELTAPIHDSEIHKCGAMANATVLCPMSADLYYMLESQVAYQYRTKGWSPFYTLTDNPMMALTSYVRLFCPTV